MNTELRMYVIKPDLMDEFTEWFHRVIVPARQAHGFEVIGPWVNREERRFTWIAHYDGPLDWNTAVATYYDSDARKSIPFDPGERYLDEVDLRMMESAPA